MIQHAHDLYHQGDFGSALELYEQLALNGDAEAMTALAYMVQNGVACRSDLGRAFALYTQAAERSYPLALFNLALFYADGIGGAPFDQFKAHELLLQAAVLEVPQAMFEAALTFERGLGCLQNFSEAAFWYEEAAKRGHAEAFNNLGVLYKEGHGVTQDYARAFVCFSRACAMDLPEAHFNLGLMFDQGLGVAEDHEKALEHCRKAAYGGHAKAKAIIQSLQEEGKIVF